jgi:hypothetical protein
MRYSGDNRPDVVVKQEILNELIAVIGKENITFILDDRPGVVAMWRANGITVYPVRGEPIHSEGCPQRDAKPKDGWYIGGFCGVCGALENF